MPIVLLDSASARMLHDLLGHIPLFQPLVWAVSFAVALIVYRLRKPRNLAKNLATAAPPDDLFEDAPIGYLEINREGVAQRVNRQQCKFTGMLAVQIVGKHCMELIPFIDRERYWEQLARRIAGETALLPYQREYVHRDGSKTIVEVHEQLLRDDKGAITGMRMAAINITERKKSEDAAYQAASELRALFQAFPDLYLQLDRNGNVLDSKGGQSSDTFLTPEKFIEHNLKEILPAETMAQFAAAQEKARKTKGMQIVEFTIDGKTGQQIYEVRLIPLNWDQWVAIARNITTRKGDEERLKTYALELERKNEELESALTTAREATKMKSRFLANMSHEIRTPMNGVLGMTDFLLGTELTTEQQEYAESIKRSADSLLLLINDILDISRIEAGKLRLDRVNFPLKTKVDETASLFALQARAKGIEFLCEIPENLPELVVGDPGRLGQVLTNLLGNAIKFTEHGRIGVMLEALGQTAEEVVVRFVVHDTGIGISPRQQERLFESFTQGDDSSTKKYGGTGLGLAISKQLVELMGGEIGVESEPDAPASPGFRGSPAREWKRVGSGTTPTCRAANACCSAGGPQERFLAGKSKVSHPAG
jgi:PAS domain S-box-containing protein